MKLTLAICRHTGSDQMGHGSRFHVMHSIDFGTGKTFKAKDGQNYNLPARRFRHDVEVDTIDVPTIAKAAGVEPRRICRSCVRHLAIEVEIRRAQSSSGMKSST